MFIGYVNVAVLSVTLGLPASHRASNRDLPGIVVAQETPENLPTPPPARRFPARETGRPTPVPPPAATATPPGGQVSPTTGRPVGSPVNPGITNPQPVQPGATPTITPPPTPPPPTPGTSVINAQPSGQANVEVADTKCKPMPRNKRTTFEFAKAEVLDVVKAISKITCQNFIIPEKIKSQKVTILSPSTITPAEAYQVFLTALEVNGITIARSGKFYKLLESKEAIKSSIPTCVGPDEDCPKYSDQMVTIILPLRYVDGAQTVAILKSLASKDAEISHFAPSNALIMSEYAQNLARIRRVLDSLDVPGFDDELQIVAVQYAAASEISEKLTQIFDVQGKGARAAGSAPPAGTRPTPAPAPQPGATSTGGAESSSDADVQISKIVPDDRTSQIIIKANRRSFEAIKKLIAKLDVPLKDAEHGRVHVHYLENASAEDLASTLSSLAQGSSKKPTGKGAPSPAGGAQPTSSGADGAVLFEGEVKITADKPTNSLIIVASGHDFRSIKRLIEELDRPRRQVYVEAAVLEITVNNDNSRNIDWHTPVRFSENDLGPLGGKGTVGFIQSAEAGAPAGSHVSPTIGALSSPTALLGVAAGSVAGIVGKGITIPVGDSKVTIPSFGVILKWLQTTSNAQILSTPHILTTDNEEASIEVGKKIPFQRGTSVPLGANLGGLAGAAGATGQTGANALAGLGNFGNLFSAIDRVDVSLKLKLTPQINERDKIKLEIDQQIEDLVSVDEATRQPITANRSAKTTVVVDDQQTIVIGGLIRDNTVESESKIPVLGDLPLLGVLFRSHSKKVEKVNLLLVLTPYIIRDATDFQHIFEKKLDEYERFAEAYYGDLPEYRARVDYRRKSGPLARLSQTIHQQKERVENGGSGGTSEILVGPEAGTEKSGGKDSATDSEIKGEVILVPPNTDAAPALQNAPPSPADENPPANEGEP